MRYEIGTILQAPDGTNWCIVKRQQYEASAHNDRWTDYHTDFLKISKQGRVTKQHASTTTDDALRGHKVVGKATVTFTVDVNNVKLEQ